MNHQIILIPVSLSRETMPKCNCLNLKKNIANFHVTTTFHLQFTEYKLLATDADCKY